jgi:hypothetical protein
VKLITHNQSPSKDDCSFTFTPSYVFYFFITTSLSKALSIWYIRQRLWPLLGVCLVRILTRTQTILKSFVVFVCPSRETLELRLYLHHGHPLLALPARYQCTIRYQFVIQWYICTVHIAVTDNVSHKSQANNSQGHCIARSQTTADWFIFRERP